MPSPALGSEPPEEATAKRRSTELWMVLFACGIVAFAFASTAFSLKGQHPSTFVEYMVAFVVIVLGAHLAIRRWAPYADPLLLPIATRAQRAWDRDDLPAQRGGPRRQSGSVSFSGNIIPITTLTSSAVTLQIVYTVGIGCFVAFL